MIVLGKISEKLIKILENSRENVTDILGKFE